jgi:hypothetical protein
MATFTLKIRTNNDAFADDWRAEVARILDDAAEALREGYDAQRLRDINGNVVGKYDHTGR